MDTRSTFQKIGVAGAGTMGSGIAQVAAMAGFEVELYDIGSGMLEKASDAIENNLQKGVDREKLTLQDKNEAQKRIRYTDQVSDLQGDLIIEAIIEDPEIKAKLYKQIEKHNGAEVIIATNTSSIPVTQLASTVSNPKRFLGIHFFNPAHIMKLVEVVQGIDTEEEVVTDVVNWVSTLGKTPVVAKDSPGFIVNRVARHFYTESLKSVEDQAASLKTVDKLLEASGFRMGPFRLMDLIGVDTNHKVTSTMFEQFYYEARFRPSKLQKQYVEAGKHGRKSGHGFYTYD